MTELKESKYEKANLAKVVAEQTHLSKEERNQLFQLLLTFEGLFQGKVGK